jgi:hypothetical protein
MGGYNSGGHNGRGCPTVDQCTRLRLQELKRCGLLRPGASGTASMGRLVFEIRAHDDSLILTLARRGAPPGPAKFVGIEKHARAFGGFQGYFVCPDCQRRYTTLLLLGERVSCRKCCRLPYQSQRSRGFDRVLTKARKAEAFLRGISPDECIGMDPPPRPKGMHRATYRRLIQPIRRASEAFLQEAHRRLRLSPP